MSWFTGTVVYILVWWTALFMVLPIGARPEAEADPEAGGWRGAPRDARMGRRLLGTTLLASVIWLGIWWVVDSDWISFRSGSFALPAP